MRSVGEWLAPLSDRIDAIVTSPVRRTRESAEVLAPLLGREVAEEPGFAEMEFGAWDGLTFDEVGERHREDLEAWLGSVDIAPGGTGESLLAVEERVLAARDRCLAEHAGRTVVVVSHVTPIKTMVAHVMEAPLQSLYRMELAPASVTVLAFWPPEGDHGPWASVRLLNALPPDRSWLGRAAPLVREGTPQRQAGHGVERTRVGSRSRRVRAHGLLSGGAEPPRE